MSRASLVMQNHDGNTWDMWEEPLCGLSLRDVLNGTERNSCDSGFHNCLAVLHNLTDIYWLDLTVFAVNLKKWLEF